MYTPNFLQQWPCTKEQNLCTACSDKHTGKNSASTQGRMLHVQCMNILDTFWNNPDYFRIFQNIPTGKGILQRYYMQVLNLITRITQSHISCTDILTSEIVSCDCIILCMYVKSSSTGYIKQIFIIRSMRWTSSFFYT